MQRTPARPACCTSYTTVASFTHRRSRKAASPVFCRGQGNEAGFEQGLRQEMGNMSRQLRVHASLYNQHSMHQAAAAAAAEEEEEEEEGGQRLLLATS